MLCLLMFEAVENVFAQPIQLPVTLKHEGFLQRKTHEKDVLQTWVRDSYAAERFGKEMVHWYNQTCAGLPFLVIVNFWFSVRLVVFGCKKYHRGSLLATLDRQQDRHRFLKRGGALHV